jgi:hypothetical protein
MPETSNYMVALKAQLADTPALEFDLQELKTMDADTATNKIFLLFD